MKESKTTYSYLIEHMEDPSFEKVWDIAFDFVQKLPSELCDELHDSLNRGIDILDSEPLLQMYIYSFGKMHNAKLQYAFNNVQKPVINYEEVEILDYGCGQGLASICYHDFIIEHNCDQRVRRITLIEPSEMALSRAELLCSKFYPDAEIIAVNKQFDDLTNDDLILSSDIPTIHLLSNILDVESYDLPHLSRLVKDQSVGDNEYILVSPMQNPQRLERLRSFASTIDKVIYFEKYLEKRQLDEDKDWTCAAILCTDSLKLDCKSIFEEAKSFYDNKDSERNSEYCYELFEKLKLCAKQGERKCQNLLGIWYEKGVGTVQDFSLALEWYKKSAKQEYPSAFGNIGLLYLYGKGVEKDPKKAVEYFVRGADLNHSGCLFKYGLCLFNGVGIDKNPNEAFRYFKKAAKEKNKNSFYYLFVCYINGIGTETDENAAIKAIKKAAGFKHKKSCYVLAEFYESGKYVEKDEKRAFRLYKESAELGYLQAQEMMGEIYRCGLLGKEKSPNKSFKWYIMAAEKGSSSAQFYIGNFYSNGYGIEKDTSLAFEWYSRSAEQQNSSALNNLAYCYEYGVGVEIDLAKALFYYEEAAKLGNTRAQKNLALCYKNGTGVNPDAHKYFYWIHEAAKQSDLDAIDKIAFYYFIGFGVEKSNENALLWYARYYSKSNNYDSQINDINDAISFFEQRAEIGDAQALYIMGKCAQYGIKTEKDYKIAHTYFEKAAELEHIESLIKVGRVSYLQKFCSPKEDKKPFQDSKRVKYSSDKRVLIRSNYQNSQKYKILHATRVICDGAFCNSTINRLIIPSSVLVIGKNPFVEIGWGRCKISEIECHSPNYVVIDHALYTSDKKELISYFGTDSKFTIPEGVEVIGEKAFAENEELTDIKFPNTLHSIKNEAFEYCLKLKTISLPKNVITIGSKCFYGCESLSEVLIYGEVSIIPSASFMGCKIKELHLPDSLTIIEENAFRSNEDLKEVILPRSVKKLGNSCFAYCYDLNNIFLSEDLQEIGDFCFYGCQINRILIPSHVNKIGLNPFIGTSHIECSNNGIFSSENGLLYDKVNGELIAHFEDREIALYPPMRKIKSFAFYGSNVIDIFIGKNIEEVEPWAFYEAEKLERIRWQKGQIKMIPVGCFGECKSLKMIDIPISVEEIQPGSFFDCYNLSEIRFERKDTKADGHIFQREEKPVNIPDIYWGRHELMGSCFEDASERRNLDISSFKKIKIYVPSGCADQISFSAIYDHYDGDFRTYGMDRDFIVIEYEQ